MRRCAPSPCTPWWTRWRWHAAWWTAIPPAIPNWLTLPAARATNAVRAAQEMVIGIASGQLLDRSVAQRQRCDATGGRGIPCWARDSDLVEPPQTTVATLRTPLVTFRVCPLA